MLSHTLVHALKNLNLVGLVFIIFILKMTEHFVNPVVEFVTFVFSCGFSVWLGGNSFNNTPGISAKLQLGNTGKLWAQFLLV